MSFEVSQATGNCLDFFHHCNAEAWEAELCAGVRMCSGGRAVCRGRGYSRGRAVSRGEEWRKAGSGRVLRLVSMYVRAQTKRQMVSKDH